MQTSVLTTFPAAGLLRQRELVSGGWSYLGSSQPALEATALAVMALSGQGREEACSSGTAELLRLQREDGGWPAFAGDSEGSWTTALALCALNGSSGSISARERALEWLLRERGKEGHWFWRWKFKTADRNVRFDPDKYGWPWISGSASWVIPTAFSVIAIKQFTVCNRFAESEKRIHLGVEMLLDRACVDGGWNSGNSIVYGVPLRAHVDATAIALLALQDEQRSELIQRSLTWLKKASAGVYSVSSLAWCILTLFVYAGRTIKRDELTLVPTPPARQLINPYRIMKSSRRSWRRLDSVTLAWSTTSTQYHRTA